MAASALQAAKDFLNINSPSRKFIEIGKSTGEGFMVGIERSTAQVVSASENMGGQALDAMRDTMAGIASYMDADMELNPTITPILDLSNVERSAGDIEGLITPNRDLMIRDNFSRANHLNEATRRNRLNTPEDPAQRISAEAPVKVEYVQNNYSPKALSTVEIYRQTNNQISTVKGLVGAR